ncbi:MAG: HAMP domain-containing protein, partial [Thioalkalivibrio sp.]
VYASAGALPDFARGNHAQPPVYHKEVPLSLAEQPVGMVRLGLSMDAMQLARQRLLRDGLLVVFVVVPLGLLLLGLVGHRLVRRISTLAQGARAVHAGDYGAPMPEAGRDELGQLAETFRAMVGSVHQRESALTEAHRQESLLTELARQEQGRLRSLLSAMNIGVLFETHDHRVDYYNPAFLRIWGIPKDANLAGIPARDVLELAAHFESRPEHSSRRILHVMDA